MIVRARSSERILVTTFTSILSPLSEAECATQSRHFFSPPVLPLPISRCEFALPSAGLTTVKYQRLTGATAKYNPEVLCRPRRDAACTCSSVIAVYGMQIRSVVDQGTGDTHTMIISIIHCILSPNSVTVHLYRRTSTLLERLDLACFVAGQKCSCKMDFPSFTGETYAMVLNDYRNGASIRNERSLVLIGYPQEPFESVQAC
jgi:hypothetical protein